MRIFEVEVYTLKGGTKKSNLLLRVLSEKLMHISVFVIFSLYFKQIFPVTVYSR